MAEEIFSVVLALPVDLVAGLGEDAGSCLTSALAVGVGIGYPDHHELRTVGHSVSFGDNEAAVPGSHLDAMVADAEADGESESCAEPVGRCAGVGIKDNGNDSARGHGAVKKHGVNLPSWRGNSVS